ncbi:MAG: DUF2147 domain-containing protein [Pseudoxanthomonas sp.]
MRKTLLTALLAAPMLALSFAAHAADATGRWTTIDDETGKPKSIVEIYKTTDGKFAGKVVEILHSDKGPNPVCDKCSGANKNKPVKGMVILWNLQQDDATHWSGGTVLDPAKGKTYKSKLELHADGKKLDMSGCLAFICRAQTWVRE